MNFYVSANGDDSTGDGTQERPFKTLSAALRAGTFVKTAGSIQIVPLTDIEENDALRVAHYEKVLINTTGSGHRIVFASNVRLADGNYALNNCEFGGGCDFTENSLGSVADCTFQSSSEDYCLRIRYGSIVAVSRITFETSGNGNRSGVVIYNSSTIVMNSGIVFRGNFASLFKAPEFGSIFLAGGNNMPDTSEAQGTRYDIRNHSALALLGRGELVLGEHLSPGTKDESSSVY